MNGFPSLSESPRQARVGLSSELLCELAFNFSLVLGIGAETSLKITELHFMLETESNHIKVGPGRQQSRTGFNNILDVLQAAGIKIAGNFTWRSSQFLRDGT